MTCLEEETEHVRNERNRMWDALKKSNIAWWLRMIFLRQLTWLIHFPAIDCKMFLNCTNDFLEFSWKCWLLAMIWNFPHFWQNYANIRLKNDRFSEMSANNKFANKNPQISNVECFYLRKSGYISKRAEEHALVARTCNNSYNRDKTFWTCNIWVTFLYPTPS